MSKSATKRKPARQAQHGHADRLERQFRLDFLKGGFDAAAQIARLRGEWNGTMRCPLCQQALRFAFDTYGDNDYFKATCATQGCINHRE